MFRGDGILRNERESDPLGARLMSTPGIESFNGKLRDELLNPEIFYTLKEAGILIEQW